MLANEELAQEQHRVDMVIAQIDLQIKETSAALAKAHRETRAVEKNYGENTSINRYEVDDIAESRSAIEQQRQLVSRAAENEDILKRQLQTLQQLRQAPYFGRIDIQDPGEKTVESLYIGTASLMNADKTDFLIYDWRAPISGVYYNGTLGNVSYDTPSGRRTTKLLKKRQFTIVNGKIKNVFDTNETVGDELLQSVLGQNGDNQYMQNIVATIQRSQNEIIRNTKSDLMIVQGAAGSGKTSTVLQRIAYLLYHAKESLNADQIVLFSPNRLFSKYISEVLPSLGERNMRQVTLAGFLNRRFEGLNVQTIFDRYEHQVDSQNPVQQFLESAAGMASVRKYAQQLDQGQAQLAFIPLRFHERVFFSAQHIADIFAAQPRAMALDDRLIRVKNRLIRELQARSREEAKADWIQKELNDLTPLQIKQLLGRRTIDDFKDEQAQGRFLARRLAHQRLRIVADAIYNNYFLDFDRLYADFLTHADWPANIYQELANAVVKDFNHDLEFHRLKLVHTAPYMYLRDLVTGQGQNRDFQYVFIDEMQDYSAAMLIYLRHVFAHARFTILGDSEQALFYPLARPDDLLKRLAKELDARHPDLITLNQSYRSTFEITNFAKSLLPDGDQIRAFNRHGQQPRLLMTYDDDHYLMQLRQTINQLRVHYPTVAILTRNQEQANALFRALHADVRDLTCVDSQSKSLPTGTIILPAYLAKGLEFDAVIVADVSAESLGDSPIGLLYTMATRAMHDLVLLSNGPAAPIFSDESSRLIKVEHQLSK